MSSESWVNLTKGDISELESCDNILLRRILKTGSKTPIPALYLELGVEPIRFILKRKRLMFLHHILNCEDDRLISQVFWAQEKNPVKND